MRTLLPLLAACAAAPDVPTEPVRLLDPLSWALASADDPFDDRPAAPSCGGAGYGAEGSVFEVHTGECPYGTFVQAAGQALAAGTTVRIDAWHMDLTADAPAAGHFALRLGGAVAEMRPEIPGPATAYTLQLTTVVPVGPDDDVFLHVHNHGSNSWYLGEVQVVLPELEAR